MARRRRSRRRSFRRIKPDMGWWTSQEEISFTSDGTEPALDFSTVLEFDDIDSDDALITQDKSDWFIKRVLLDVYPVLGRPSSPTSGPARIWEFAVGTMQETDAAHIVSNPAEILDPGFYERWRRLFKTYTRPVYATWDPSLHNGKLLVDTATSMPAEVNIVDSPWGPASIHDDFSVSNAGLVDNSGLYVVASTTLTPPSTSYDWAAGDTLSCSAYIRVLLQKRRT